MICKLKPTPTRNRRLATSFSLVVVFFLLLSSCDQKDCCSDEDPNPTPDLAAERGKMANHVASHFIKPAYVNLADAADQMEVAMQDFNQEPNTETLDLLRDALKTTWLSWQDAAIYQMGPTENNALRAAINLYPADVTKIEENISSGSYTLGAISNQGAEGLPAIDYLINAIEADQVIDQFAEPGRMQYLATLIAQLKNLTFKVSEEWSDGPFLIEFTSERARGSDVGSAIGLLTNAIDLHFQRFLRDGKVAIPAGVRSAGVPRPQAIEALYGDYSRDLLVRGLQAYIDLFEGDGLTGTEGVSYFKYLDILERNIIAEDLRMRFSDAQQKSQDLNPSFTTQIETNNEALVEVFLSLQQIVTQIKSDLASVLGITITNQDNDGD